MTAEANDGWSYRDSDRAIVVAWPPEGRFAGLWSRLVEAFPDDAERADLLLLLHRQRSYNAVPVAVMDVEADLRSDLMSGTWVDLTPDWTMPDEWLRGSAP